jgi:hypothetical protein
VLPEWSVMRVTGFKRYPRGCYSPDQTAFGGAGTTFPK